MTQYFRFDGQVHVPLYRLEKLLLTALERKLNGIIFTDYSTTSVFDALQKNQYPNDNRLLNRSWHIKTLSPVSLRLQHKNNSLFIFKGEEIATSQGHILAWGIHKAIADRLPLENTFKKIYKQDGIAAFAHPFVPVFGGCNEKDILHMQKTFSKYSLAVEVNAQLPSMIFPYNKKIKRFAHTHQLACFGNSDLHGAYHNEHLKIGSLLHNSISQNFLHSSTFFSDLSHIIQKQKNVIHIEGKENSITDILLWNFISRKRKFLSFFSR